jgi:hypothetical protein
MFLLLFYFMSQTNIYEFFQLEKRSPVVLRVTSGTIVAPLTPL